MEARGVTGGPRTATVLMYLSGLEPGWGGGAGAGVASAVLCGAGGRVMSNACMVMGDPCPCAPPPWN